VPVEVRYDEVCLAHEHPDGAYDLPLRETEVAEPHPDKPERLTVVERMLRTHLADHATWPEVEPATREQLERVHDADYLDSIWELAASGGGRIEATTGVSPDTPDAVLHAVGATVGAAERALETDADTVPYALVRPSGHHAQPARADGYCLVNNVAVAAEGVLAAGDAERVAVVDWDVHPGNGTQECFYDREDVLFVSLHNDFGSWGPSHPQTSRLDEQGTGDGEGYTVNVPLPPGTGNDGYALAFDRIVEPVVREFDPDLLLVSAGQDGSQMDPNGNNVLTMGGFREMGRRVRDLADGNLALVQEGGYNVSHLAYCTLGAIEGALGVESGVRDRYDLLEECNPASEDWIDDAVAAYEEFWPVG
jgi:acetoin utilization deacetylase AcuC-like enzyme